MKAKDVPTYDRTLSNETLLAIYRCLQSNPLIKSPLTRQYRRYHQLKSEIELRGLKP